MAEEAEPGPAAVADVKRDLAALMPALVYDDHVAMMAILKGAEHSGTLRSLTEALLGATREPFVRYMLAVGVAEEGTLARSVLDTDLNILLTAPGIRKVIDEVLASEQQRIIRGDG